jgi:hypothetical protein
MSIANYLYTNGMYHILRSLASHTHIQTHTIHKIKILKFLLSSATIGDHQKLYYRQCLNCRGDWGVEPPSCLLNPPPKQDAPGYPGGCSFNPPAVVNDAESPVSIMTMTMNRQMSTPHLFFDNSNPDYRIIMASRIFTDRMTNIITFFTCF